MTSVINNILRILVGPIVLINLPLVGMIHCMAWMVGMGFIFPLMNWIITGEYKDNRY